MIVIFISGTTNEYGLTMHFRLPGALTALLAIVLPAAAHAQPNVVATVGMIGDIAETVGGECVSVTTLMGPGTDPHLYQATARDVQTFGNADLILYSGLTLEGQLADILSRLGERKPALAVSEVAIPEEHLLATDDSYGVDPHVWMDTGLWAQTVSVIADALSESAPECAQAIADRAQSYEGQLIALDQWVAQTIASIPETQRVLVTAHDAFSYFGHAYGIEVAGIQGISTSAEASIADIRETAELLIERGIPAIFVESTINPRTIQAVIDAAGRQGHTVTIGGELFADAMGDPGTPEGTYIGMIVSNTLAIAQALGGDPAPFPAALSDWAARTGIDP
ncbi:metal ABC transporter solute-binding protein, Zn/Mn family [Pelagibacterium limicola]|uniref:metal ABC transporter solute-binding protein, Zn/Mn family n=1 Tax=Pelagibacterium limicola TaxID=2791022 RepID=UPI001FE54614|nr:zinc ABC transporter substrate-binding protein [Pelagibacterium limicola]